MGMGDLMLGFLQLRDQGRDASVERTAAIREADSPSGAIEQAGAEPVLQLPDATAHRRLGDAKTFRRGTEASAVRHGQEGPQLFESIHVRSFGPSVRMAREDPHCSRF